MYHAKVIKQQFAQGIAQIFLLMMSIAIVYPAYAFDFSNVNPNNLSAATLITNLGTSIPQLMQLVTALAYVMGFYFIFNGLLHLKKYGEQRSQMSSEAHLKGPLLYLLVGTALIYLPSTVHTGLASFWTNPVNPYAYETDDTGAWADLIKASFMIIQLIGVMAFIKGLVMLTHLGGQGAQQQGVLGKAIAHIVGGIFCIDMYDFLQVVFNTLALGK
jgi:intracellular multiplication protein IcmC